MDTDPLDAIVAEAARSVEWLTAGSDDAHFIKSAIKEALLADRERRGAAVEALRAALVEVQRRIDALAAAMDGGTDRELGQAIRELAVAATLTRAALAATDAHARREGER